MTKIKRYIVTSDDICSGIYSEENENGDFVMYEDIKHLLEHRNTDTPKLPSYENVCEKAGIHPYSKEAIAIWEAINEFIKE